MTIADIKTLIKNRRLELGLTLKEVAERVGVSESTVSRWEDGNIANMKRNRIAALADVLQISASVLMGFNEEEQQKGYYTNPETAKVAQEIHDNPDMRILFDAAKDVSPEDLKFVADMVSRMRKKERNEDD